MKYHVLLLWILIMLLGCHNPKSNLSESDTIAIRELHEKTESAVFSNEWDEILKLYTEDAIQIAPKEEPLIGKSKIAKRMYL